MDDKNGDGAPVLAMRAREAARSLGISERTLWTMTNAGQVPHVKIGRATVYPVRELEAWLSSESERKRNA